jgi:4-hydroxythreonine-4-phosphate dehydrogenase
MKPLLAMTMGDPAGIGAEIIIKAFAQADLYSQAVPFVIGSPDCLALAMKQTGINHPLKLVNSPEEVTDDSTAIQIVEPVDFCADDLVMGQVASACGEAAVRYFEAAVTLCLQDRVQGVVTCPINKEAVHAAGFIGDIGHQEILGRMTDASLTATMLMTGGLKVAHLSTHKSLAEAVAYVKKPVIVEKLKLTVDSLVSWGLDNPVVAVAALNPHGGEGGMLGREEIDEIQPAVEACREMGLDVRGPFPADSIFYRAVKGEFDAVLALYHDQGHIAIKVHNFEESVTATMGIPFVRTSVDHGTAFDIAGKNKADAGGLIQALSSAIAMLNQSLR